MSTAQERQEKVKRLMESREKRKRQGLLGAHKELDAEVKEKKERANGVLEANGETKAPKKHPWKNWKGGFTFGQEEKELRGESVVAELDYEAWCLENGFDGLARAGGGKRKPRHTSMTEEGETDEAHEDLVRVLEG